MKTTLVGLMLSFVVECFGRLAMRNSHKLVFGASVLLLLPTLKAQTYCSPVLVEQRLITSSVTLVQGTVQDRKGDYVSHMPLTLTGGNKPKIKQVVTTDDHGHFKFGSVPGGKYQVQIFNTAGNAKRPDLRCNTKGVCNVAFVLKPPKGIGDCTPLQVDLPGMPGN